MASSGMTDTADAPGRRPARLIGLVVAVALLLVVVKTLPVNRWLLDFVGWVRDAGTGGMVVFVLAYVLACVLFLPGSILTLGAGFAYGVVLGTVVVWVASN